MGRIVVVTIYWLIATVIGFLAMAVLIGEVLQSALFPFQSRWALDQELRAIIGDVSACAIVGVGVAFAQTYVLRDFPLSVSNGIRKKWVFAHLLATPAAYVAVLALSRLLRVAEAVNVITIGIVGAIVGGVVGVGQWLAFRASRKAVPMLVPVSLVTGFVGAVLLWTVDQILRMFPREEDLVVLIPIVICLVGVPSVVATGLIIAKAQLDEVWDGDLPHRQFQ